jgi:hypothetical protein
MLGIIKTPPTILNATPSDGAEDVFVDDDVTVWLRGQMNSSSVTPDTFYLTDGGQKVDSIVKFDASGKAVLLPLAALEPYTRYTVKMTEGVEDLAGNNLAGQTEWGFMTGASTKAGDIVAPRQATPTPTPTGTPTATPGTEGTSMSMVTLVIASLAILGAVAAGTYYFLVLRK